jgi:nickel/cobalt transporter (NiCoT) family protein
VSVQSLPRDWLALCLLIFVLGLKHGFDADHLATIDGLTRFNMRRDPRLARYCGVLFSLGHGAVVLVIALVVGNLAQQWQAPRWLDAVGAWISIGFLLALGGVNVYAVLRTHPTVSVRPFGIKGRLLGPLAQVSSPWLVALVGALFALSFDTVSQAGLFAMAATQIGGWEHALVLGTLFLLGMLLTDGANGLWISRLISRADQIALVASRVMGLVVGGVSLVVAAFTLTRMAVPTLDAWSSGKELLFGLAVVGIVAASFVLARWLTRRTPAQNRLIAMD